jgi:hypothetical protein
MLLLNLIGLSLFSGPTAPHSGLVVASLLERQSPKFDISSGEENFLELRNERNFVITRLLFSLGTGTSSFLPGWYPQKMMHFTGTSFKSTT